MNTPKMMHGYLVSIHDVARAEAYKRFADLLTSGEIVDQCGTFDELEELLQKLFREAYDELNFQRMIV